MILRCVSLIMIVAISACDGERMEINCEFIEKTERGVQCEFENVIAKEITEIIVTPNNLHQIDAVSFRGSELYSVPAELFRKFPHLKHLDVEQTMLRKLESEHFQNASELKYFLARFNLIAEIHDNTFLSCPKLKFIVLQYNKLSNIDSDAFNGLANLEALYLDHNQLQSLQSKVLHPLNNLMHLSLAYNNLTNISEDSFMMNDKLETLNLGHNLLTSFSDKIFETLPNLEHVQLDHNELKTLDLRSCKSLEIDVSGNNIEAVKLNEETRYLSASGNPIKLLTLHEHYGTTRNYNFSFTQVSEIIFFVNENCCTRENLENFGMMIQNFGDLSRKGLEVSDWNCKLVKNVSYATPTGLVVNDICQRQSQSDLKVENKFPLEIDAIASFDRPHPVVSTAKPGRHIINPEDYIASDETTRPRESLEDISYPPGMFEGMDIETLPKKTTTTVDPDAAHVEEIFPTTESYDKKAEKGIFKAVKNKLVGWKNKAVKKWNDWVG